MSADPARLYRYRARIPRHPASIYDGDTFIPLRSMNLPAVDFASTSTTAFAFAPSPPARVVSGT